MEEQQSRILTPLKASPTILQAEPSALLEKPVRGRLKALSRNSETTLSRNRLATKKDSEDEGTDPTSQRPDRRCMASVPEGDAGHRGMQQGGQIHTALLLSSEIEFARQLPHVPHRDGDAQAGPGSETRNWPRRKADHQLDTAP